MTKIIKLTTKWMRVFVLALAFGLSTFASAQAATIELKCSRTFTTVSGVQYCLRDTGFLGGQETDVYKIVDPSLSKYGSGTYKVDDTTKIDVSNLCSTIGGYTSQSSSNNPLPVYWDDTNITVGGTNSFAQTCYGDSSIINSSITCPGNCKSNSSEYSLSLNGFKYVKNSSNRVDQTVKGKCGNGEVCRINTSDMNVGAFCTSVLNGVMAVKGTSADSVPAGYSEVYWPNTTTLITSGVQQCYASATMVSDIITQNNADNQGCIGECVATTSYTYVNGKKYFYVKDGSKLIFSTVKANNEDACDGGSICKDTGWKDFDTICDELDGKVTSVSGNQPPESLDSSQRYLTQGSGVSNGGTIIKNDDSWGSYEVCMYGASMDQCEPDGGYDSSNPAERLFRECVAESDARPSVGLECPEGQKCVSTSDVLVCGGANSPNTTCVAKSSLPAGMFAGELETVSGIACTNPSETCVKKGCWEQQRDVYDCCDNYFAGASDTGGSSGVTAYNVFSGRTYKAAIEYCWDNGGDSACRTAFNNFNSCDPNDYTSEDSAAVAACEIKEDNLLKNCCNKCFGMDGSLNLARPAFITRCGSSLYEVNSVKGKCDVVEIGDCRDAIDSFLADGCVELLGSIGIDDMSDVADLDKEDLTGMDPTAGGPLDNSSLASIVSRAVNMIVFPLAGLLLFVMIVWGGLSMITGSTTGQQSKVDAGKKRVTAAIVGFVILFAAYWILQVVENVLDIGGVSGG